MGYFQGRGTASLLMMMMMMMIVSLCVSKGGVLATNYKVGDSKWTIMSYDSWLSGKTFKVGDTLEFVYSSGAHDVVEVDEANYGSCSQGSNTVYTDGDTKYTLSTAGTTYYICTFPGHCAGGMKLAVTAQGSSTSSPAPSTPSTSTSPSPTNTTITPASSNTTTTTTTPTPSANSSPLSRRSSLFFSLPLTLGLSILFFKS